MKKVALTILVLLATINLSPAQEKGLFLFGGGNIGMTKFIYTAKNGENKNGVGYGGGIGAQYFFTENIGLSLGIDFSVFNTKNYINDAVFKFDDQIDDQLEKYNMTIKLNAWEESQKTTFLEIPLLIALQKKIGRNEMSGVYFGIGPKLQIPIQSSYQTGVGDVSVWALYKKWKLPLGDPNYGVELPQHNLGTNHERSWTGNNQLKTGVAITGELGFLIGISRRIDLRIGVSADYGLINVKKSQNQLIYPTEETPQQAGRFIADLTNYSGILNSEQSGAKIFPLSVKGNLGIRIKIGKLKERPETSDNNSNNNANNGCCCPDTLYVSLTKDTALYNILKTIAENVGNNGNGGGWNGGRGGNGGNGANGSGGSRQNNAYTDVPAWYQPEAGENLNDRTQWEQAVGKAQQIAEYMEESIYFELGKSDLRKESIEVLNRKVEYLRKYPKLSITVVGHTCDIGGEQSNELLSYQRSETARQYMISRGINSRRIAGIPMGKRYPDYPNISNENRELNRRVDFIIIK